jgi:hypothetical protein
VTPNAETGRRYLTQEELVRIQVMVEDRRPVPASLVRQLLSDREWWIEQVMPPNDSSGAPAE